jgi:hypothetical protein
MPCGAELTPGEAKRTMEGIPKRVRRQLRELAGIAYERELSQELEKLAQGFEQWRQGKIDAFELNDLIHKHHNGASRDLWKHYHHSWLHIQVAYAVRAGILREEEVPEEAWLYIEGALAFYQENAEESPEPDSREG